MKQFIEEICLKEELKTFDPYDIWKTNLGFFTKNLFYKNKFLGAFLALPLSVFDSLNSNHRFFYKKQEYPVVRAFAALSLINLYKIHNNHSYLHFAKIHIDWLLKNYCKDYSGMSWGINFSLPISHKLVYDNKTPFVTNTPYILEALVAYFELTEDKEVLEYIKNVYLFFELDVQVMFENPEELATSYGPQKDRIVNNAVSYSMYSYAIFWKFILPKREEIEKKVKKMYNFLKRNQEKNGAWLYSPEGDSFIDCFHSCFVIKNILKTKEILDLAQADETIYNGYQYIIDNFKNEETGLFKRFTKKRLPTLVKFDLYDNAEVLNLLIRLGKISDAQDLNNNINKTFLGDGGYYSQIDFLGFKKNKNTLRWAVMPYVYATTELELLLHGEG